MTSLDSSLPVSAGNDAAHGRTAYSGELVTFKPQSLRLNTVSFAHLHRIDTRPLAFEVEVAPLSFEVQRTGRSGSPQSSKLRASLQPHRAFVHDSRLHFEFSVRLQGPCFMSQFLKSVHERALNAGLLNTHVP